MGWRVARSLEVLRREILRAYPDTTVWDIGDADHRASASDHNPNSQGVVCAVDVLGDGGLDLAAFAEAVRVSGHPALKYVIHDRRIASAGAGWRYYGGSNPHTSHVHVSVGVGRDGRSTGPYDDTTAWDATAGGDDDMIDLRRGDEGQRVKHLQSMLRRAGFDPGEVDGDYGPATAAAVLACRKSQGSGVDDGDWITGWAATQIHMALIAANGGGERGPQGPPGELPEELTITGTVRVES